MANLEQFKSTEVTEKKEPQNFPAMLKAFLPEIQRALPRHLNGDRMSRIALTAFRRTPGLANCDPRSVFAAVIQAAQLGLEPDTMGRAYLIPYGTECQFVPGWKGLVDLVNRSGMGNVWAYPVFEGDDFTYNLGTDPKVHHIPKGESDADKITHVYAVGRVKGQEWPIIEVWPIARCLKHRDRYNKVGKRHYSYTNWEMYVRKIVLLQVIKYMPASPELIAAIDLNDSAEIGEQHLTVKDAIEGTFVPMPTESHDETPPPPVAADSGKNQDLGYSYAQVLDKMLKAKDSDALDEAADLISMVSDSGQQKELRSIYQKERGKFL